MAQLRATDASPNVGNYYVGKGVVSWSTDGGVTWRDLGDVSQFAFQPTVVKLDHYSSRTGVRTKDLSVVTEQNATVNMMLSEFSGPNIALALMGADVVPFKLDITATLAGTVNVTVMSSTAGLVTGMAYNVTGPGIPVGTTLTWTSGVIATLSQAATISGTLIPLEITDPQTQLSLTAVLTAGSTTLGAMSSTSGLEAGVSYNIAGPGLQPGTTVIWTTGTTAVLSLAAATGDGLTPLEFEITGVETIDIFTQPIVQGSLRFVGTNIVGPRMTMTLLQVSLTPSKALGLIEAANAWGEIELTGDVTAINGVFGSVLWNTP